MLSFLRLIRWKNLLIILFTQGLIFIFLREGDCLQFDGWRKFLLLTLSTNLIAAAGYIINDYYDIKIDVINKPNSIIVNRFIASRKAILLHTVLNIIGVAIGFYLSIWVGVIDIVVSFLLWQYSVTYKYLLLVGNLTIAALMAVSLVVTWIVFPDVFPKWIAAYAGFAFVTGLIREIIKDVEDMKGDEAYECKTVPIVFGIHKTKVLLNRLLFILGVLLVSAVTYLVITGRFVLPLYLTSVVGVALIIYYIILKRADTKSDFTKLSGGMKLIMLFGILAMALRCAE